MLEHLDKLQLVCFFLISYLLSRVFVRFNLPHRLVHWLCEEKHMSVSRLAWLIITGTALLSMVIANVITLLALVPVLTQLQLDYHDTPREKRKFATLIILSAVWGANIGGMGMLTGTTTNGILVGMFEAYKYPISENFTFLSWMTWAAPLSFLMCLTGWLVLMLVFRPNKQFSVEKFRSTLKDACEFPAAQRIALWLTLVFLISTVLLSFCMTYFKAWRPWIMEVTLLWTLFFLAVLFLVRFRIRSNDEKAPLLEPKHILHDLPKKGLLWILIGVLVTMLMVMLKFPDYVTRSAVSWIKDDFSLMLLLLIVGLITTFATEIVSNSVIQIAMFMTLFPLSRYYPEVSWQMMLIITLTSTCAFMSPIATPSNGLGFGSSKSFSLAYMLGAGLLMNLFSAALITAWVYYVVPVVIAWFA